MQVHDFPYFSTRLRRAALIVAGGALLAALSACGAKGPLYMPKPEAEKSGERKPAAPPTTSSPAAER